MFDYKTTGGRGLKVLFGLSVLLYSARPSHSYTVTQTESGANVRWHYGQKLFLAGNPNNDSGISAEALWNAVVNGLQQWKRASKGMFDFDYWQGNNPIHYPKKQEKNGINSIFFTSQSNKKSDPNIIGYTQVWFNSDSGDIIESDIILNDRDFNLTETPTDTSSRSNLGRKNVYINNVITHELGHAIGLSHSNSINSSMLYVEFSEQNKLGCDDWTATRDLYPTSKNGMGSLIGNIIDPSGAPVTGAVVTAISTIRGIPMASVHSDQNGRFNFGALEIDEFSLIIEPYRGSDSSIPASMRVKQSRDSCGQGSFSKNFITEDDRYTLKKFRVLNNKRSNAGTIQIHCNEQTEITDLANKFFSSTIVDRGEVGSTKSYTFIANGPFQITGLGYLLLSPVNVALSVDDRSGNILYRSEASHFKIEDNTIQGTAFGPTTLRVEIKGNEPSSFPMPAIAPDKVPLYVLVFSNANTKTSTNIPNNARCDSKDPLPPYQSPKGNPIQNSTSSSSRDGIGFCGNAQAAGLYSSHQSQHHSRLGSILGWAFPFLAAIVCQLFLRIRRAKLNK